MDVTHSIYFSSLYAGYAFSRTSQSWDKLGSSRTIKTEDAIISVFTVLDLLGAGLLNIK
jgi:hypothetical protein